jgi:hypothetical protein
MMNSTKNIGLGSIMNAYSQEYPEDWLRRTQQRPNHKFSDTAY